MNNPWEEYPVIMGGKYIHAKDNTLAILTYADCDEDLIRLNCCDSPWIFESNHATFSFYWKLQE